MRDPNRITEILELLEKAWKVAPDLRLCQLISNITYSKQDNIFNIEDEELVEMINEYNRKTFLRQSK